MQTSTDWLGGMSVEDSIITITDFALEHARKGGVVGANIADCITRRDWGTLIQWQLQYPEGCDVTELYHCRQALGFFKKAEFLPLGVDRKAVALEKLLQAELLCRETNEVFHAWRSGRFRFRSRVEAVLHAASNKIANVLGDVPRLSELGLRNGPGATTNVKRLWANARNKFSEPLACSSNMVQRLPEILQQLPHLTDLHASETKLVAWEPHDVQWLTTDDEDALQEYDDMCEDEKLRRAEINGSGAVTPSYDVVDLVQTVPVEIHPGRLSFVPKDAGADRTVITQPMLATLVQLAVGDHMVRKLHRVGIDLTDQTVNQQLAKFGSLTGALATLDLSSASDTIAIELVASLLPVDWFCFLSEFRVGDVDIPGAGVTRMQQFSSMGNGYTFPLETLIFWALTSACCEAGEIVSVYGDDIICPTERCALVQEVLVACGFKINTKKSYVEGPFRESCGTDWYAGFDIRPYHQKQVVSGQTLFVLHNYYYRTFQHQMCERVRSYIPTELLLFGPDGYGDGHLLGEWSESGRRHDPSEKDGRTRGWSGFLFDTFTTKARKDIRPRKGDYVAKLYTIYRRNVEDVCSDSTVQQQLDARLHMRRRLCRIGVYAETDESGPTQNFVLDTSLDASLCIVALPLGVTRKGRFKGETVFPLPGADSYKRVSVYTFERP